MKPVLFLRSWPGAWHVQLWKLALLKGGEIPWQISSEPAEALDFELAAFGFGEGVVKKLPAWSNATCPRMNLALSVSFWETYGTAVSGWPMSFEAKR